MADGERRQALPPTRLVRLSRATAMGLLALIAMAAMALAAYALVQPDGASPGTAAAAGGDLATYARIVARLHGGEAYYSAAHAELLAGDYGTRSVFNWRTPLYFSLVALTPSPAWAQAALGLLAFTAAVLVFLLYRRGGGDGFAIAGGLLALLAGAAAIVPGAYLFAEVPAGLLILLSVAAYGLGWRAIGIAAAVAALFIRELAAPYVLVCGIMALGERRWRETDVLIAAVVLYAAYFAWHATQVNAVLGPGDRAYAEGWLHYGGLGFVLATAAFNGVLIAAPVWATAALLPFFAVGLVAWPSSAGLRAALTVALYAATFAVVGKPFDVYWGALYAPLLTIALPWAAAGTRDLLAAARRP